MVLGILHITSLWGYAAFVLGSIVVIGAAAYALAESKWSRWL